MATTPGEGDGGTGGLGGTASSICAISPSDLVGTIGNLISRIENLEFQLSQVVGANLHTESLDNISEQVGWVYGVEYMGYEGWIMTPAGTLIPPPGFTILGSGLTLSDGNTYSAVLMDSDGVLQYGFTTDGQIAGEQSGSASYGIFATGDTVGPDPVQNETSKGVSIVSNDIALTPNFKPLNSIVFRVSTSGLYCANITASGRVASVSGGTAVPYMTTLIQANDGSAVQHTSDMYFPQNANSLPDAYANHTIYVKMAANQTIQMHMNVGNSGGGTPAFQRLTRARASLVRVASL